MKQTCASTQIEGTKRLAFERCGMESTIEEETRGMMFHVLSIELFLVRCQETFNVLQTTAYHPRYAYLVVGKVVS